MLDVEEAWEIVGDTIHLYYAPKNIAPEIAAAKIKAAVRDVALTAYDAGVLAERRYGRWRRPYMMEEKRARIQALGEPR